MYLLISLSFYQSTLCYSGWQSLLTKSHRPSDKNPGIRHEKPPFQWLRGLCKRLPRQLATVLGCLPEVKGKDTMHFQHRTQKIQPGSDLKASSWELDLIALGGALPVAKEGKQSILLPSCDVYEPQEWPAQQAIPETATVTLISWQAVTHSPLIGRKLFYRREVTPGSGNLVNCPQLVMQWILEENLLPPLY